MDMIVNKANVKLFDEVSLSSNITSDPFEIRSNSLYCVQHRWKNKTGTVTILVQGTNFAASTNDEDYFTVDTYIIPTGSDTRGINIEKAGYSFVRLKITQTSGSGTLTSIINAKVL